MAKEIVRIKLKDCESSLAVCARSLPFTLHIQMPALWAFRHPVVAGGADGGLSDRISNVIASAGQAEHGKPL